MRAYLRGQVKPYSNQQFQELGNCFWQSRVSKPVPTWNTPLSEPRITTHWTINALTVHVEFQVSNYATYQALGPRDEVGF
jgi:hypothetical protein